MNDANLTICKALGIDPSASRVVILLRPNAPPLVRVTSLVRRLTGGAFKQTRAFDLVPRDDRDDAPLEVGLRAPRAETPTDIIRELTAPPILSDVIPPEQAKRAALVSPEEIVALLDIDLGTRSDGPCPHGVPSWRCATCENT